MFPATFFKEVQGELLFILYGHHIHIVLFKQFGFNLRFAFLSEDQQGFFIFYKISFQNDLFNEGCLTALQKTVIK